MTPGQQQVDPQAQAVQETEDDEAVLLRVRVTGAELWEAPNPVTRSVSAAKALVLRRPPGVGDNETVQLASPGQDDRGDPGHGPGW